MPNKTVLVKEHWEVKSNKKTSYFLHMRYLVFQASVGGAPHLGKRLFKVAFEFCNVPNRLIVPNRKLGNIGWIFLSIR